jgi:hypothetical protein
MPFAIGTVDRRRSITRGNRGVAPRSCASPSSCGIFVNHVGEGLSPVEGERRLAGAALRYMFSVRRAICTTALKSAASKEARMHCASRPGTANPRQPIPWPMRIAPRALAIDARAIAGSVWLTVSVEPTRCFAARHRLLAPA